MFQKRMRNRIIPEYVPIISMHKDMLPNVGFDIHKIDLKLVRHETIVDSAKRYFIFKFQH